MSVTEPLLQEPVSVDQLAEEFERLAPAGTFEVDLPGNRSILFRYPARYGEVRRFWRELIVFWNHWSDKENLLEELKPYAPADWAEAYAAFLVYFWAAPENRFSAKGALRLNRNAWIMESIRGQIESKQRSLVDEVALTEIEEAGKGSPGTSFTGNGSGSAATPSGNTPTS